MVKAVPFMQGKFSLFDFGQRINRLTEGVFIQRYFPISRRRKWVKMEQDYLTFDNMYKGLKKCCNGVRWKTSVTQFEMNALKNTAKAISDLKSGNYKLSDYQSFTIYEPKLRHITATKIKDRQVQRSLCDTTLYNLLTKSFIHSNGACQKGKGTEFVLKDFKKQLQRYYRKHGNEGYYLKCDIHHFFESINHEILKDMLIKRIDDAHILRMVFMVIDSFGDRGLGLGSQISQLLALFCLDELDHVVKEKLHIKVYTRYMDDFILISESKEKLIDAKEFIESYLSGIDLQLNSNKTILQNLKHGVMYLHWKYEITDTGKVLMLPDKKRCTKRKRKIKRLIKRYQEGKLPIDTLLQIITAMKAHLSKGNAYKAKQEIDRLIFSGIYNNERT